MLDLDSLVQQHGTPFFRYDLADVRAAWTDLRAALPEYAAVFYSVNANPHPDIVATLRRAGGGAQVSSSGELTAALAAGFTADAVLYTGLGTPAAELRTALDRGVRLFSTESVQDLRRVTEQARAAGVTVECLIKVDSFGAAAAEWAPRVVDLAGPALAGFRFVPGSNAVSGESILAGIEGSLGTAARLHERYGMHVRWLDLGGGFAAPYAAPGSRPQYGDLRDRIDAAIRKYFEVTGEHRTRVAFESGRYLVAASGTLVTTVMDTERSNGRSSFVLDARIDNLDVRAADAELPATRSGDRMVIPNVGAYAQSASLVAFASADLPPEVVVDRERLVSRSRQQIQRVPLDPAPSGAARSPDQTERQATQPLEICRPLLPAITAHAARVDAEAVFPVESLALLRKSGLLGLLVPREYGGLGGGLHDLVEVTGALATACSSTAMIFSMHCQQADSVVRFGSQELRASLLPRIARGEVYLASITSERESGGHALISAAPLTRVGPDIDIDRDAPVVTGGAYADGFLVTMRAGVDAPPNQVSLVYADRDQVEVRQRAGGWDPLGMRATASAGLHLRGRLPAAQLVGQSGRFREIAVECLIPLGYIGLSAAWLGTAKHALAQLVGQLRSGGRGAGLDPSSDLFAERLARARHDLELVSAYLARVTGEVADRRSRGETLDAPHIQIHVNTLKVIAAELCFAAVDRVMQLAGLRLGYMKDSPLAVERAFRDLRSAALNYSNDRLLKATGTLQLIDGGVRLV